MASSSGNSSGSLQPLNSGSYGDMIQMMDQRKRKRMQSNRESARRSRMRKQQHLDDLMAQVSQLRKENNQLLSDTNVTTQHYLNVEAENTVLRAQMAELSQRLQSLDEILSFISSNNGGFEGETYQNNGDSFVNPWNFVYSNQPITAASAASAADIFHF